MLLGLESSYSEAEIEPEGRYIGKFWDVYAMDDWHASNRLTLNLGLRWDGLPHAIERNNHTGNFVPADYNPADAAVFNSSGAISATSPGIGTVSSAPGSTIALSSTTFYLNGLVLAGRNGVPRGVVANHWTDFGPRVGFAYNVFGTDRTVLRAGAGLFSQEISEETDISNNALNPPFLYTPTLTSVYFSSPNVSTINGQSLPGLPILVNTINSMMTTYPHPKSAQYSLGIQQQLNRISILSVAYVGSGAWHQIAETPVDPVPLSDPNRAAIAAGKYNANLDRIYLGYGGITQQENTGNLHYNSLQATFRIQDRRGEAFHAAYTYSKALGILAGVQSNPFNPRFDYGPTSLDQRHVFVADYIAPIPIPQSWSSAVVRQSLGGWQITGITIMQSGQPVTPTLGINNLGLGAGTARPNLINPLDYPKTRLAWFDKSVYQVPTFGSFGDASAYSIRMPGRDEWNMALFKTFALTHDSRVNLQFRADAYNTFNHTQFDTIQVGFNASNFGQVLTAYDPRVFQLSLRLAF